MNLKKLLIASILLITTCGTQAQTKVIAHRGYWKTSGSAQNSIASLIKADSIGCYASEFDVWLAADDQLVVNHDFIFKAKRMEHSPSTLLTSLTLSNNETMPTLVKYLSTARGLDIKLVLELKKHKSPRRETQAVEKIVALVEEMGMTNRVEYISFSLHAVQEFIRLAPAGTPVFYVKGTLSPKELKEMGCTGPDYALSVYRNHPQWIKACKELGLRTNVWTVNKVEDMQWAIDNGIDCITTNDPVLLQNVLQRR